MYPGSDLSQRGSSHNSLTGSKHRRGSTHSAGPQGPQGGLQGGLHGGAQGGLHGGAQGGLYGGAQGLHDGAQGLHGGQGSRILSIL